MGEQDVAVVGLAVRVPGAGDPETFWANLLAGRVSLPGTEPGGAPLTGRLERVTEFDADLFGLPEAHAEATDPQHRVLLELVWEALERASVDTTRSPGTVGVYVGCGRDAYLHQNVLPDERVVRALGGQQIKLGNDRDFLAAMLSYRLGFTGPSMTVQTACSTSLVAAHQAVRGLLTYECDLAIAGGVTVQLPLGGGYDPIEGGIAAADGRCRPFTTGSTGTVPASGAAVVVLRRAQDAADRGEPVLAHIVGTAVGNDGADRMSPVAPSPRGQAEVIREALEVAGLTGADVGYVETHGTGTALGDQVELSALAEVYGAAPGRCAVGAVKANVGHTDIAAGLVGLVKAVLALRHGILPPTPRQPGDGADLDLGSPRLVLPRDSMPWPANMPRRAAVSAFGLGGTNAHAVLTPAPARTRALAGSPERPVPVVLSAATAEAVREQARRLAAWLETGTTPVASVAAALWHGRRQLGHRWAVAVTDRRQLRDELAEPTSIRRAAASPEVAVVLPGQGGRLAGAGMPRDPEFRRAFHAAADLVCAAGGPDVRDFADWPAADLRLGRTAVVQPLLFAVQSAALTTMAERGLRPHVLLGHSVGELVAAAHAGVFAFADAASAVVRRGALMGAAPAGAMVAVRAAEEGARELADGLGLDVCARNAPDNTVLGGRVEAVDALEGRARERGVQTSRLRTAHAFHSADMAEAANGLTEFLRAVPLSAPRTTVLSNVTGTALTADQATAPGYWGRQLAGTVRFDDCLRTLLGSGPAIVLSVDRDGALTRLVRSAARLLGTDPLVLDVFGDRTATADDEPRHHESAMARAWTAGVRLDLLPHAHPVPPPEGLPTYPFAAHRHWLEAANGRPAPAPATGPPPAADIPEAAIPEDGPAAPEDELAARVVAVWQNAFGGPPLRLEDDFFELGGTSLQAAQLVAVLGEELLVDVRLHDLYESPTLADFVARVRAALAERDDATLLRLLDELEADDAGGMGGSTGSTDGGDSEGGQR